MFFKSTPILLLLSLFLFSHSAVPATKAQKIEKLLDTSGLEEQIREFPGMLKAGLQEQWPEVSAEEQKIFIESAEQTISSGPLLSSMRHEMDVSLNDSQLEQLIEWMDSELGKKVTKARNQVATDGGSDGSTDLLPGWLQDSKRLSQAAELDRLTGQSETGAEIALLTVRVMFKTMVEYYGLAYSEYESFLRNDYQSIKREIVEEAKPATLQILVSEFGKLTEKEIDLYLQWSATPVAQQFFKTQNRAFLNGTAGMFQNWAELWATELSRYYDE
ncbi:hypothetical protein [Marinobacter sp. CHS3-4]|uniref:hypothetical protein n=1 Tax=Marinobacter sp. CHS3-4 TaxID=3045174 RepID=UPI0024B49DAC|nr:hypothetical protein [Marinobacter sp. CHS3-4]MDI9246444.1 hypothetical protein [Marinobacter sp. CHS3-4]